MKCISFLLFFLFVEMRYAEQITSSKVLRIPLTTTFKKMKSAHGRPSRSIVIEDLGKTVGLIGVGMPQKDFKVVFDTGSTESWVFSDKYDTCDPFSDLVLKQQTLYSHDSSSKYEPILTPQKNPVGDVIKYGIGWVFGFWASDLITVDGVYLRKKFLEVTKADQQKSKREFRNGLVGLKYHPTKGNIISEVCDSLGRPEKKFSYYLPKVFDQNYDKKGELVLCAEDEHKYVQGTMNYYNESDPGSWMIRIDRVEVNYVETPYHTVQKKALVDTGTNVIIGPAKDLVKFFSILNPYVFNSTYPQEVECSASNLFPPLTFYIGGKSYTLTYLDYTMLIDRSCYVLIKPRDGIYHWTFGEPFLRKYYTVFDMKNHRIGFADNKG